MKACAFEYERARDVGEAVRLLSSDGAKLAAGMQSLGPMLNLRLVQPALLVDIRRLDELRSVREEGDTLAIGACVTHAEIEDGRVPGPTGAFLRKVASRIAYRAVRNRGTIGGSIAHADPAADWVSALALIDARAIVRAGGLDRPMSVAELVISSFTTRLGTAELIRSVRVPKLSAGARWGFYKFNQKAGEFAHAIGGVLHDPARSSFRAVIGAIETVPIVIAEASTLFPGGFGPDLAERFDRKAALQLLDRKNVKDEYIRSLALVALKRAAQQACAS